LITDSISTLPVDAYRRTGEDAKEEIAKPLWLSQPTVDLDFTSWCTQVLTSLLLHGNAYIAVMRSEGRIVELVPLDPTKVLVRRERGRKVYIIAGMPYTGEILHLKGLMMPGSDVGLSPIEYARQSIGLGLASVKFGAQFFEGEGNMPGVIEMPGRAQPDTMKAIADSWRRRRREGGRGLPGVLQEGAIWKPTGVTNEQAQFLATRQFTAAEIAGQMFMVDPTELGIGVMGQSLTYANLEQRNTRFVRVTLLPWIVRIEKALSDLMAQPRYVKFNLNALLRGDLKTRYESYAIGIASGFLEVNEPRDWEELPPIDAPEAAPVVDPAAVEADDARMVAVEAALRSMATANPRTSDTHIYLRDSMQVDVRQDPIVLPTQPPAQVTVNVEPTPVTVHVEPTPIEVDARSEHVVNVTNEPAQVTVNVPKPDKPLVESVEFERDSSGKITGAKKRTI
jgi:HK97 family phage portal protein